MNTDSKPRHNDGVLNCQNQLDFLNSRAHRQGDKYLFFHLHDRHAAEDLTQEAFLRFLGSRTYRDENRRLQYLYTIARNLCRQYYRDRTITYSLDEEADVPEMNSPEAEGFEQSLMDRMILSDALQKLSPEEKELLFLRYVNDVPVPVISGLYQISRFAVYRKLRRILQKVRVEMEAEQDE